MAESKLQFYECDNCQAEKLDVERGCGSPPGSGPGGEHYLEDVRVTLNCCPTLYLLDHEVSGVIAAVVDARGPFPAPDTYGFAEAWTLLTVRPEADD